MAGLADAVRAFGGPFRHLTHMSRGGAASTLAADGLETRLGRIIAA